MSIRETFNWCHWSKQNVKSNVTVYWFRRCYCSHL